MRTAVLLLNFGEPEEATMETVVPFLERIFLTNATLEPGTEAAVRARSRQLAESRAPGLIAEYEEIGGSPLNRQAKQQAEALRAELERRGHDVRTYVGMQFTEPSIEDAVRRAKEAGADRVIGLPVYPVSGPSTTIAALRDMDRAMEALGWSAERHDLTGWHTHPDYVALRAAWTRDTLRQAGIDVSTPGVKLVFSAHGTPLKYVREGSPYVLYSEDSCRRIADALGVEDYATGYQNHTNRKIDWTQPNVEDVIEAVAAETVVVLPVSFMHEQSETLAELDHELRE
jgi:protoporphyrin/coproporphyrin ferrochelatase